MQEAVREWLILDEENIKFHMGQYDAPYRSTVKFLEFLRECLKANSSDNYICDFGCGAGAALGYLINEGRDLFKGGQGFDICPEIVEIGNRILKERKINNCKLDVADIFELNKELVGTFDGVISLQTFNILPDYENIATAMCGLEPSWMAFSSLGFEGMIDYKIKLFDYTKEKDGECAEVFYNIYSLPRMEAYFKKLGYNHVYYKEFEIDIDLPKTNSLGRGTYTVKDESGKRIQISGGMMMPWYFVFVSK